MKKLLLGSVAAAALMVGPAVAADMRGPVRKAPPVAAAPFSWAGFYIGGHAGYAWGRSKTEALAPDALDCGGACDTVSHDVNGAFGGLHIGYNWQSGAVVFGLELEGGYIGADGSAFSPLVDDHFYTAKYGAYGAFTGRLGVAVNRTLFYAKGGGAVASIKNEAFDDFPTPDPEHIGRNKETRFGWAAGGGIEHAFTNNWSIRVEYLYMDFGRATAFDLGDGSGGVPPATDPSPYRFHNHLHTVRGGLTYKFGGPVVARY